MDLESFGKKKKKKKRGANLDQAEEEADKEAGGGIDALNILKSLRLNYGLGAG
jgi:hypothetical protein